VFTTDAGLDHEISREGLTLQWRNTRSLRAVGELEGIHILYIPNRRIRAHEAKLFTASYWNEETKIYFQVPFDILHIHEVHIPGYRLISQKARERGVKLCLSCHGSLAPPVHRGIKKLLHHFFDPYLRKGWFLNANAYFALCQNERDQYIDGGVSPRRIHIIPHGQPCFVPPFKKLPFPISEHTDLPTFLYLGRLNYDKGVLCVIKAYCALIKKGYRTRLICCGPDEGCLDSIKKICSQEKVSITCEAVLSQAGVYILPEIPHQSIPTLFSLTDSTICPSPYEIFGLVPVESLLCGVPILATLSYGCLEHLSASKDTIRTIKPGDIEAIQDYMFRCPMRNKQNPTLSPIKPVLPSWDEVAQRVCDVYRNSIRE